MNKRATALYAAIACSVLVALWYARDARRERARADALLERVFEMEPVERSDGPARASAVARADSAPATPVAAPTLPPKYEQLPLQDMPLGPKAVMDFPGSLRARRQVERLQLALVNGTPLRTPLHTPLQDYQIQALIGAIDDAHRESGDAAQVSSETNERILQLAADILFESQFEVFVALLREQSQADSEAER
jgi:hypothetical protein